MALTLALVALAAIVGWNIAATIRVAGSVYYDARRKRAQYVLIWLLPVVGATVAFFMAKKERTERVTTDLTEKSEKGDYELRMNSASGRHFGEEASND